MSRPSLLQTDIRTAGDAITQMGYKIDLGIGFPNAYCVNAKDTSCNQATFIGAISSDGSLRETYRVRRLIPRGNQPSLITGHGLAGCCQIDPPRWQLHVIFVDCERSSSRGQGHVTHMDHAFRVDKIEVIDQFFRNCPVLGLELRIHQGPGLLGRSSGR
jgi:hypothetical protein